MLKVTRKAKIRSGPSAGSKVIGKATPGAKLQVKARENGWVHFVDPSSGKTGWIWSNLVAPALAEAGNTVAATGSQEAGSLKARTPSDLLPPASEGQTSVAGTRSEEAPSAPQQPRPMKKRVKPKSDAPSEVAKQRLSRPSPASVDSASADLPDDEEFLTERPTRRMGFVARRRTLREGLLSPSFLPPE
jgi:hypothetical protein